jgi:hypothetical protein
MMLSDGRILIADVVNSRWVTVTNGTTATTPFAFDGLISDAVVGNGDIVYCAVTIYGGVGQPPQSSIIAYAADDLSTPRYQAEGYTSPLILDGNDIVVDLADLSTHVRLPQLVQSPTALPLISPSANRNPQAIIISTGSVTIRWVLPSVWSFNDHVTLADNTVAVYVSGDVNGTDRFIVRLASDGRWSVTRIARTGLSPNSLNQRIQPAGTDILVLSGPTNNTWRVVRIALAPPTATGL